MEKAPEKDPHGKSQHERGAKLDDGKPRMGMVLGGFSRALRAVGEVGTLGAIEYTDDGWTHVPNGEQRYTDAMLRHYFDEQDGGPIDKKSGRLHAAHCAWNALARLDLAIRREEALKAEELASVSDKPWPTTFPNSDKERKAFFDEKENDRRKSDRRVASGNARVFGINRRSNLSGGRRAGEWWNVPTKEECLAAGFS